MSAPSSPLPSQNQDTLETRSLSDSHSSSLSPEKQPACPESPKTITSVTNPFSEPEMEPSILSSLPDSLESADVLPDGASWEDSICDEETLEELEDKDATCPTDALALNNLTGLTQVLAISQLEHPQPSSGAGMEGSREESADPSALPADIMEPTKPETGSGGSDDGLKLIELESRIFELEKSLEAEKVTAKTAVHSFAVAARTQIEHASSLQNRMREQLEELAVLRKVMEKERLVKEAEAKGEPDPETLARITALESELAQAKEEASKLSDGKSAAEEKVSEMTADLAKAQEQAAASSAATVEAEKKVSASLARIGELEAQATKDASGLKALQEAMRELGPQTKEAEEARDAAEAKAAKAAADLVEANARLSQITDQLEMAKSEQSESQKRVESAESELSASRNATDTIINDLKQRLEDATDKLSATEAALERAETEAGEAKGKVAALSESLQNADSGRQAEAASLKERLSLAEAALKESGEKCTESERQLSLLQASRSEAVNRLTSTETERLRLFNALTQAKESASASEAKASAQRQTELAAKDHELLKVREAVAGIEKAKNEAQNTAVQLQTQLKTSETTNHGLRQQLTKLQATSASAARDARGEVEGLRLTNTNLSAQLTDLSAKLNEAEKTGAAELAAAVAKEKKEREELMATYKLNMEKARSDAEAKFRAQLESHLGAVKKEHDARLAALLNEHKTAIDAIRSAKAPSPKAEDPPASSSQTEPELLNISSEEEEPMDDVEILCLPNSTSDSYSSQTKPLDTLGYPTACSGRGQDEAGPAWTTLESPASPKLVQSSQSQSSRAQGTGNSSSPQTSNRPITSTRRASPVRSVPRSQSVRVPKVSKPAPETHSEPPPDPQTTPVQTPVQSTETLDTQPKTTKPKTKSKTRRPGSLQPKAEPRLEMPSNSLDSPASPEHSQTASKTKTLTAAHNMAEQVELTPQTMTKRRGGKKATKAAEATPPPSTTPTAPATEPVITPVYTAPLTKAPPKRKSTGRGKAKAEVAEKAVEKVPETPPVTEKAKTLALAPSTSDSPASPPQTKKGGGKKAKATPMTTVKKRPATNFATPGLDTFEDADMNLSGRPKRTAARTGRDQMLAVTTYLLNSPAARAKPTEAVSVMEPKTPKTEETTPGPSPPKKARRLSKVAKADWVASQEDASGSGAETVAMGAEVVTRGAKTRGKKK